MIVAVTEFYTVDSYDVNSALVNLDKLDMNDPNAKQFKGAILKAIASDESGEIDYEIAMCDNPSYSVAYEQKYPVMVDAEVLLYIVE